MKYLKHIFFLLFSAIFLAACGSDTEDPVEVSLTPETLEFTTQGGQQSISVFGVSSEWVTLPSGGEWYELTKVPNDAKSCYIRVKVKVNTAFETREAALPVKVADKTFTVKLYQEAVPAPVVPDGDAVAAAMAVSREMGLGWNLGNQLDAQITWDAKYDTPYANETCWGNPLCTQATFDGLKAKGFGSVRIPVTWQGHIGDAKAGYAIDEVWMNRVAEVVGYAKKAGLKAIINLHHDEGGGSTNPKEMGWLDIKTLAYNPTANAEVEKKLAAVWRQIAERFKDEGDWLIFESMNEIQDGGWGWGQSKNDGGKQYACLNHWQQVFVDAVRAVGGKNQDRWLCVVGYAQNPQLTRDNLVLPTDPTIGRLMVAVHSYDPFDYCTEAKVGQWGHTGNVAASKKGEETLENMFKALKETYIDKGIPVIVGEFGCVNRTNAQERKFQKYFLEYFVRCGWTYGIASYLWDNGSKNTGNESFGYIDHGTGQYLNYASELVPSMVKAATDPDPAYSLQSIYNKAP